ncbi:PepSY domain-containing protein [Paenibacillus sp. An7]|uniref:PepSY domain-containing protein n=1 Tax=Paenibacillus sp. An7 TaxID=2689577 RepID=UPI0013584BCF|nr:PepSY domain-containing protein [Paenibacillus sp. An7]
MNIKKKLGYAGVGAAVLIGLVLLFVQPWNHAKSVLSAEAVEETVISQYPGTVEKSTLENGEYHLRISTDTGTYEFAVDSSDGSILSIQQISKSGAKEHAILSRDTVKEKLLSETGGKLLFLELITKEDQDIYKAKVKTDTERTLFEIDPYTAEVLSRQTITIDEEDNEEENQKFLAEEEVEKIAMAEVEGEVDDTELRGEDTNHPYYLVEIETDDDKEAVIQIHAITGQVQSVTWDD